jgi:dipeptidyl aminopeptidase/acylaminoacyl peptidase
MSIWKTNHRLFKLRTVAELIGSLLLVSLLLTPAWGQFERNDVYQMPPKPIADLLDAPFTPSVSLSPNGEFMLLMHRPGLPGIDEVSQPELKLAGVRINPRTNGPSRGWYYNGLKFQRVSDLKEGKITGLPDNPKIADVSWSPDGQWVAFTLTEPDRVELWAVDLKTGLARKITNSAINAAYGNTYEWVSDSKTIIAKIVVPGRGEAPPEPLVPTGPAVQENIGGKKPARTYQDMLKNTHDEELFDYYATSHVVRISLDGREAPLGNAGVIASIEPSPNGKYLLVETLHRPYSYTVPAYRFPHLIEVWDMDGKVVATIDDLPLADNVPIAFGSVRTGRRDVGWRQDADATLYWAEALDGGDAGAEAEERDRVYMLKAPFDGEPTPLLTLGLRFYEMLWGDDDLAIAHEWWWETRKVHGWAIKPDKPNSKPQLIYDYSFEDRYNDPGNPMMRRTSKGTYVLQTADDGKKIFLAGDGASPEGDRPFLDEFEIATQETTRLFRSQEPYYERPVRILDEHEQRVVTRRESVSKPPNYFVRDLDDDKLTQLTYFPHPTPQLADVQKELIRYKRADGVDLTATLYLPAGYDAERDGPLPMLMWAYPQEFKSADAAGQVTDSPYRFVRTSPHSPLLWLVDGYAVLDDPTMPIIGEGDAEPNDTYVEQLVASAKAAVDEVVRRGVTDYGHIAIGGHSYGAFMAANLLAHSDLFAAGIARSGAYNRTLTPFGFQAEERTFWQAPEVYFAMSPFMHADSVNEPLLLIHGEDDNNSGTFPIQSERFYDALKGLGATVRLCMLPHEAHGYRARESIMHMAWEMTRWLDKYVKNARPKLEIEGTAGEAGQ